MKKWLRHIRNAVTMGITWAAGWTLICMLGVVVFYTLFPSAPDIFDIWILVFAYPGFLAGVSFSVVLRIAEGRRRLDELSLPRLAAFGTVVGLPLGVLLFTLGAQGARIPLWLLGVTIVGSTALLSVVSAVGSALLFRYVVRYKIPMHPGPER